MIGIYGLNESAVFDTVNMEQCVIVLENLFQIDIVEFCRDINLPVLAIQEGQIVQKCFDIAYQKGLFQLIRIIWINRKATENFFCEFIIMRQDCNGLTQGNQ